MPKTLSDSGSARPLLDAATEVASRRRRSRQNKKRRARPVTQSALGGRQQIYRRARATKDLRTEQIPQQRRGS